MTDEERLAKRREIHRAYRERNREKVRAQSRERVRRWTERHPERARQMAREKTARSMRKALEQRPEEFRARKADADRRYRESHKEEFKARHQRWRDANRPHLNRNNRAWYKSNLEKAARTKKINAARRHATPGRFTKADEQAMYERQQGLCARCGVALGTSYHRDHIIPVVKGGTHWPDNRQLLCQPCNARKGAS